ncbi:phage tail tape measure protein [Mesorhizobium sp. B1-1-2]|uniref:phage tail tape measure protein n=1 Tax=Mesorhizobium sp. B1-1-2 TaxID=2589982 RepID=UPI00112A0502|nr:phage tail tape measure protein [Mesorhizobium sp. B1-1-2]TPN79962.1 phage tail tape measure protein [Mesorhizobium sp. B1-1-2]
MKDLEYTIRAKDASKPGWDSARRNAAEFNGELDRTGKMLSLAGTAAKAFAIGFAVEGVRRFADAVHSAVVEYADLADSADRVGLSVEQLQRFQFGLTQAGVDAGAVDTSLEQWSKRIGAAVSSGGRLADIFKANNISLTDSNGKLRSNVDLLRQYANLIQGAATDQERIALATDAFGRGGADMVLALKNGASGIDDMMQAADRAGGVVDEKLVRRAAELDDKWNEISRTIDVTVKEALIGIADWTDVNITAAGTLLARWEKFSGIKAPDWLAGVTMLQGASANPASRAGFAVGALAGQPGMSDPNAAAKGDRVFQPLSDDAFNSRFAGAPAVKRTIIPPSGAGGGGGSKAIKEQISDYDKVIARLKAEEQAVGLDRVSQEVLEQQRRAGVTATSEQGKAIETLVRKISAEEQHLKDIKKAQEDLNEAASFLGHAGLDALDAWASGAESAGDAVKQLGLDILKAATNALLFNEGPLAGILGGGAGGGGGGLIGTLFTSLFGGARANGGPVDPWKDYLVGEKGPEILRMGSGRGSIVSNDNAFGGRGTLVQIIDQRTKGGTIEQQDSDGITRLIVRDEIAKSGIGSVARHAQNHAAAMKRSMIK